MPLNDIAIIGFDDIHFAQTCIPALTTIRQPRSEMGAAGMRLLLSVLAGEAPVPVRLADERLTTVTAQRSLRDAGVRAKGQRAVVDQAAAVAILQGWLDQRRAQLPQYRETGDG